MIERARALLRHTRHTMALAAVLALLLGVGTAMAASYLPGSTRTAQIPVPSVTITTPPVTITTPPPTPPPPPPPSPPTASTTTTTPPPTETITTPPPTTPPPPAPAVGSDRDGDGTSGPRDRCPGTPRGGRALLNGCTVSELLRTPARATGIAREQLRKTRRALSAQPQVRRVFRRTSTLLRRSDLELRTATRELDALDTCDAARHLRKAAAAGSAARRMAATERRSGVRSSARRQSIDAFDHPEQHNDTDAATLFQVALEMQEQRVAPAVSEVTRASRAIGGLCRKTTASRTLSGKVLDFDPNGMVTLRGGKTLSVAGYTGRTFPVLGVPLTAKGPNIDGVLYAEQLTTRVPKRLPVQPCLEPQVLAGPGNVALPLDGFRLPDGQLLLEGGTGIAVTERAGGCPASAGGGKTDRRYLVFSLERSGASHSVGVSAGEREADFLIDRPAEPSAKYTLSYQEMRAVCGEGCEYGQQVSDEVSLPVDLRPRASLGKATVGDGIFDVRDEQAADAFKVGTVNVKASPDLPGARLLARAFVPTGTTSSFPQEREVLDGEPVAVHADSQLPLTSPQLIGSRNDSVYLYEAKQTKVVTDRLKECGGIDSYYAFPTNPFAADAQYSISQGPFGKFSHQNTYSWDIPMAEGQNVRAARGGTVIYAEGSHSKNWFAEKQRLYGDKDKDDLTDDEKGAIDAPGNGIAIEEQDGHVSYTFHHPKDRVFVKKGDKVRRGRLIAEAGNVGYSTGSHLHWQLNFSATGRAFWPAKFQGLQSDKKDGTYALRTCYEPKPGEWWVSLNTPTDG